MGKKSFISLSFIKGEERGRKRRGLKARKVHGSKNKKKATKGGSFSFSE